MSLHVIVQARLGSSRFPGKVLQDLGGAAFLKRCLDRCHTISGIGQVICAIPDKVEDDVLLDTIQSWGYIVSRGSETDLLARYAKAARDFGAEMVMRITSDCPFIDPDVCAATAKLLRQTDCDFACNNFPPTFPHGLDCEVFSAQHLFEADRYADIPYEREHVTPWLRANPRLKRSNWAWPDKHIASLRWTLDYPEDARMFRAVYNIMGESAPLASWLDYLGIVQQHMTIPDINMKRIDCERLSTPAPAQIRQVDASPT